MEKLYFLARDGYMPLIAAKELAHLVDPDIELRYLNVSRYSLRRARYLFSGEESLDTICTGGMNMTFRKLMKRAALTEGESRRIADLAGMGDRFDAPISYQEITALKERLKKIPLLVSMIEGHAIESYGSTKEYFLQEGLLNPGKIGIVDTGWIGTVQESLEEILEKIAKESGNIAEADIEGFYFGLYEIPDTSVKNKRLKRYNSYYIHPRGGRRDCFRNLKRKSRFSICLFEAVCSSPEGMTYGYESGADGGYVPVRDEKGNPNAERLERYGEIIRHYASKYAEVAQAAGAQKEDAESSADMEMVQGLLSELMSSPASVEVELLGNLLFCDDVLESDFNEVAAKWSLEDIEKNGILRRLLIKSGLCKGTIPESGWSEGSIVRAYYEGMTKEEPGRGNDFDNSSISCAEMRKALRDERIMKALTEIRKALQPWTG